MNDISLQLLQRRNALYERAHIRRSRLEESYKFQMFERDCDETKIWINEKLKAASDEGYLVGERISVSFCLKRVRTQPSERCCSNNALTSVHLQDPTNLQGKLQKHQNADSELQANQGRIDDVTKTGEELISADHYAKDQIRERIDEMQDLWKQLVDQSGRKGADILYSNAGVSCTGNSFDYPGGVGVEVTTKLDQRWHHCRDNCRSLGVDCALGEVPQSKVLSCFALVLLALSMTQACRKLGLHESRVYFCREQAEGRERPAAVQPKRGGRGAVAR